MLNLKCFVAAALVLVGLSSANAEAAAPPNFGMRVPSSSGSFLAGQQAFKDMRSGSAARYFLDAAEKQWENPVVVERAFSALAADGKLEDAAAVAQHLLEIDPNAELANLLLATVALKERRYASAEVALRDIKVDSFIGITSAILKGWALVGDGRYIQARTGMMSLGEGRLQDFLLFHEGLMADVAGERNDALTFARNAYAVDPYIGRIVEAYARVLANDSRFDDAQEIIAEYQAEGLNHPVLAEIAGKIERGVKPGKLAPTVQSGAAKMYHSIGAALAQDGLNEVAVIFLQFGIYLDPNDEVIALSLAAIYDRLNHLDAANDIYEGIPNNSVLKSAAMIRIAQNLEAMGDRAEAVRRLSNMVAIQPDNVDAIQVLGDFNRIDGNFAEAVVNYNRAIELSDGNLPSDWSLYYQRGIAYELVGDWPRAEKDFLKALDLNPGDPQVLNFLGYGWVDRGINLTKALGMIREAVNYNPADGYIVDSLGWAYYKLNRLDEAVQTLEQAVQLRPNDPDINDHLGDAYWLVGRKLEARFQWNIAISVDKTGDIAERAEQKLEHGLDAVVE